MKLCFSHYVLIGSALMFCAYVLGKTAKSVSDNGGAHKADSVTFTGW